MNLREKDIVSAVARIDFRAERRDIFLELYEDTGVLDSLASNSHQVIQGRRGSGKTHLIGSFEDKSVRYYKGFLAVKVDLRDCTNFPPNFDSATRTFWTFWVTMHQILAGIRANLEVVRSGNPALFEPDSYRGVTDLIVRTSKRIRNSDLDNTIVGRFGSDWTHVEGFSAPSALFSDRDTIQDTLEAILNALSIDYLVILLDEWSSVQPVEGQPEFAEALKKALFKSRRIAVKIATIRYRSRFETISDRGRVGLELGADLFANIDLDLEVVWERDPAKATRFFSSLLRKHLRHVLVQSGLSETELGENGAWYLQWFSSHDSFRELVRAGEGIPRDFLNIFKRAYSLLLQDAPDKAEKISIRHVRSAAANWFEEDKRPAAQVDAESYGVFQELLELFVARKKIKHFMIAQTAAVDDNIQKLVDNRLLHRIKRGWSSKHHPGIRYDVFSIDYGAFVNLMDTDARKTLQLTFEPDGDEDSDVPLETVDLRNIRHQLYSPTSQKKEP